MRLMNCLSTYVSPATYYRHTNQLSQQLRQHIVSQVGNGSLPCLHWLDNFAKYYKASSMYTDANLLQSVLWTAHGVKILPYAANLHWSKASDDAGTISAMPFLEQLLADPCHVGVLNSLRAIPFNQYDNSLVVTRDVRRIPLKH